MAQQPQIQYSQVPVTVQPMQQTTTTVVVSQPAASNWDTGLFGCFDDLYSCESTPALAANDEMCSEHVCADGCCAWWLGPCYYACVANTMGEHCCVGCSGHSAGIVPGGHIAMRSAFRNKHGIPGTICTDCLVMTCCLSCGMCQLARQMERLGYEKRGCC